MSHRIPAKITVALATAMLILIGCGGSDSPIEVTDNDSGSEISIDSGQPFVLRLESNPSTGYRWTIDPSSPLDVVELVASSFEAGESDAVGASGTEVLSFQAIGPGAGVLRLTYERSFDNPPVPDRVVEFVVRVDDAAWPPSSGEAPETSHASTPGDLESYPPQCGEPSVVIDNPGAFTVSFDEAQGVRWTPNTTEIDVKWDGLAISLS